MLPAMTMGDPAGIGPELTMKAWSALRHTGEAFLWIGDPTLLASHIPVQEVTCPNCASDVFETALPVWPLRLEDAVTPGRPDSRATKLIMASIERATRLALAHEVTAVITNPIHKAGMRAAGFSFPGHTEFLAALCGVEGQEIMMLASPRLRVVPVTVHMSLREALATLSTERIITVGRILAQALKGDFGFEAPRIAVAGLNPHAGESGVMGDEEKLVIQPAIDRLSAEGVCVRGPFPPDTMFTERARAGYDAALCMYHDQALIPLKTLDMQCGVNVTLGLPVVRTSPDHGTAFDIAGKGEADPQSLIEAVRLARALGSRRTKLGRCGI